MKETTNLSPYEESLLQTETVQHKLPKIQKEKHGKKRKFEETTETAHSFEEDVSIRIFQMHIKDLEEESRKTKKELEVEKKEKN